MADIKEEMSKIEKAYKGKEIKEAILSALDKVNETNGTARYLDGHPPDTFLSQDELNEILPLDSVPTEGSNKGISSGKIYSYLMNLAEAIDDVNVVENTSGGFDETIKEKLEYLNETKQEIRKEIADHGVDIHESTPLSDYQHLIGLIEMEADHEVEPLEVTENKTYEAPEGHAYNPVTVEVPFNLTEKPITKNGKYKAETDGVDGFSAVVVDGSSMLRTKNVSGSAFPEEMETLKYKAKDEGEDVIGYSEIKIDLSDKVDPKKEITLDAEEAGEEYVYEAKDDGVYGYGKFILSIRETKTEFTVQFISEGETVYVETDVPMGGSCSYGGDTLEREGYIFAGWNPQPVNIVRDTKCIAQWEVDKDAIANADGRTEEGQTIDDMTWNGVMAHPDRIHVGDTKYIYWAPFTCNGRKFKGGKYLARCVRTGEENTNSTWVMMFDLRNCIENVHKTPKEILYPMLQKGAGTGSSSYEEGFGYTDSFFYDLGNELANAIKSCNNEYRYPGQANLNFQSVKKPTIISESRANTNVISYPSLGNLWLLSAAEKGCPKTEYENEFVSVNAYPGFGWNITSLTPCRTIKRRFHKSSKVEEIHYGIPENTVLWDYINFVGLDMNANTGVGSTGAYCIPYGYVINNDGYRNEQRGLTSSPGAIIRSGESGEGCVGLGMTSDALWYGFCL